MASASSGLVVQYGSSSDEDDRDDLREVDDESEKQVSPGEVDAASKNLLPPSPVGDADPYVQENIRQCIEHQRKGYDFNSSLKAHESFGNPYIFETVAKIYSIDENGTNMPKHIYNPKRWQAPDFYQELARKRSVVEANQQEAMRMQIATQQQQANLRNSQLLSGSASPIAVDPQIRAKIREQQQKIARHLASKK